MNSDILFWKDYRLKRTQSHARTVSRERGFTLAELLVVVTAVTALVSILLRALGAGMSREQTRQAVCASNMRQLGAVHLAHLAETDDEFLTMDHGRIWWVWLLEYELRSREILACPSMCQYGFFDSYEPGWCGSSFPGDYRGGSKIAYPDSYRATWVEMGCGYNRVVGNGSNGKNNILDFRWPDRTALHAECGGFYWHNYAVGGLIGFWYSDRHGNHGAKDACFSWMVMWGGLTHPIVKCRTKWQNVKRNGKSPKRKHSPQPKRAFFAKLNVLCGHIHSFRQLAGCARPPVLSAFNGQLSGV